MNEQFNTSDIVERTDKDTNSPVVNRKALQRYRSFFNCLVV